MQVTAVPAPEAAKPKPPKKQAKAVIEPKKTTEADAEAKKAAEAAAAAQVASDTPSSTPPTGPGGTTAVEPPPAAVPPAPASEVAAAQSVETTETETKPASSVNNWIIGGVTLLGLGFVGWLMARRKKDDSISIFDRDVAVVTGEHPVYHRS